MIFTSSRYFKGSEFIIFTRTKFAVMNIILRIIISAVVAFGLSYLLSGVHIQSFVTALILAIVLGL